MGQTLTAEQVLDQSGANLDGKVAIVTGASTGLGKETARVLAKGGARVIMACRNKEKADKAAEDIRFSLLPKSRKKNRSARSPTKSPTSSTPSSSTPSSIIHTTITSTSTTPTSSDISFKDVPIVMTTTTSSTTKPPSPRLPPSASMSKDMVHTSMIEIASSPPPSDSTGISSTLERSNSSRDDPTDNTTSSSTSTNPLTHLTFQSLNNNETPVTLKEFSFASTSYDSNFHSFSVNTTDPISSSSQPSSNTTTPDSTVINTNKSNTTPSNSSPTYSSRRKIGTLEVMHVDLSDLQSVRKFVKSFLALNIPLHLLVCNAGVMACPFALTKQGFEYQFGVNYVAHFFLTRLLIDKLKQSSSARIVVVSSVYHKYGKIEWGGFLNDADKYKEWNAYAQSKLALILFTKELDRRLTAEIDRDSSRKIQTNSPTRPILTRPLSTGIVTVPATKRRSSFNPPQSSTGMIHSVSSEVLRTRVGRNGIGGENSVISPPTTSPPPIPARTLSSETASKMISNNNTSPPINIPKLRRVVSSIEPNSASYETSSSTFILTSPQEPSHLPSNSTTPTNQNSSHHLATLTIPSSPENLSHHFSTSPTPLSEPSSTPPDNEITYTVLASPVGTSSSSSSSTFSDSSSTSSISSYAASSSGVQDSSDLARKRSQSDLSSRPDLIPPLDGEMLSTSERTVSTRVAFDISSGGTIGGGGNGGGGAQYPPYPDFSSSSSRRSSLEQGMGSTSSSRRGSGGSDRDRDRSPSYKIRPKNKSKTGRCTVHVLHPGTIKTDIYRELGTTGSIWKFMGTPFFNSVGEGAATILYCCLAPWLDLKGGGFYSDCSEIKPSRRARNMEDARKLWWETERMIKFALERDKLEKRKAKQLELEEIKLKEHQKIEETKKFSNLPSPTSPSSQMTLPLKVKPEDDIEKFIAQEIERKQKTRAKMLHPSTSKEKFDEKDDWQTEMYAESDSSNSRSESRPESYFGSGFIYHSPPTATGALAQDERISTSPTTDEVVSETPTFPYSTSPPLPIPTDSRTISEPRAITKSHYSQTPPHPLSGPITSLPPILQSHLQDSPEQIRSGGNTTGLGISIHQPPSQRPSRRSVGQDPLSSPDRIPNLRQPPPPSPATVVTPPSDWVPDSHRLCCILCGRTFSLLFRRHHCRNCGEVVCGPCSTTRVQGQRFCDTCKKVLERREARQRHWG